MEKHHRRFLFSIALVLGAASGGAGAADDATLGGDFPRIIASAKQAPAIVEGDGMAHVSVNYSDKVQFWFSSNDRFSRSCLVEMDIPDLGSPYIRLIADNNCDGAIDAFSMSSTDELRGFDEISENEYLALRRLGAAAADSFEAMTFLDQVPKEEAAARMNENPYLMPERLRNAMAAATESMLALEDPSDRSRKFVVTINFGKQNVGQVLRFSVTPKPPLRPNCILVRARHAGIDTAFNEGCNAEWDFVIDDDGAHIYDKGLARSVAMSALDSLLRFAWVANEHFALDPAQ